MAFETYAPGGHHADQQESAFMATLADLGSSGTNPGLQTIYEMIAFMWDEAASRHYADGAGAASAYIASELGPEKWSLVSETVAFAEEQLTSMAGQYFNGVNRSGSR